MSRRSVGIATLLLTHVLLWAAPKLLLAANGVVNPGFENNVNGWTTVGGGNLFTSTESHSGSFSGVLTERESEFFGIGQSVLGTMENRKTYRISAWLRLDNSESETVQITVLQADVNETKFFHPAQTTAHADRWVNVSGLFTLQTTAELTTLLVFFEGPSAGVNYFLDDVVIEEVNWKTEANKRIDQIRKQDAEITVLSLAGEPASGVEIEIRQRRHLFGFGSTIHSEALTNTTYANFFVRNFEWAVPETDLKWSVNEPEPIQLNYATADALYEFARSNNLKMRGHAVYWSGEVFVQEWLKELSGFALEQAIRRRMADVIDRYQAGFEHWEVNNEMLDGSFLRENVGELDDLPVRVWMFKKARELNPNVKLFLNEFGPISFGGKIDEYKKLARDLMEAGAPIDGIGLQCHTLSNFNRGLYISRFEAMAELGLPIWVTEFDVDHIDDQVRANDFEDFYRIAFSQPSVEGIIMFGFWESNHWRSNGHIVDADWTLNEAGQRYESLMDEWTTNTSIFTDAEGKATFRGFHGTYDIAVKGSDGGRTTGSMELLPGEEPGVMTIRMQAASTTDGQE